MEDDFLIVPSGTPDSYCRLCLSETNVEVLLLPDGYPQPKQNLVDLIRRLVDIGLSTSADSPCGICASCRMMLEEFERFRERCLRCDYALTGLDRQRRLMLPFECSQCPSKFRYKIEFDKHWKSFHDLHYRCELCDATFATKSMLDDHSKFHDGSSEVTNGEMFHCSYCPRMFSSDRQLRFHVQALHEPNEPKSSTLTQMLIDPMDQLGLAGAGQLNIKPEPIDSSQMIMNLSSDSALNMAVASSAFATDLQHSTRGGDTTATESEGVLDGSDLDETEDDTFYKLDNGLYQCKLCPETMRHLSEIRNHTKMQHPSHWKSFMCTYCKRRFPSGPMRDRHVHFHSLNHPFKCSDCDQMYRMKKNMNKHFRMYHETSSPKFSKERFHCVICQLSFVERKYRTAHSKIYHDRKPQRLKNLSDKIQVCERCVKRFDSRDQLAEHIREVHQGDDRLKSPVCQVCSKDMKTTTLLRIHIMVVHMGIMPFECEHCNAEFSSRHWLLKHMEQDHSEIALYKCSCCDESFTTEVRMNEHKDKLHAQVFLCVKCDKKFETQELLDEHEKTHPLFILMYTCPLCSQPVRFRKQHMRVHHDVKYDENEHKYQVRYKCHCCTKFFQQKSKLLAHQNSVANQCGHCSMRFKTKKCLSLHMATHHPKRLQCEDCGLDFRCTARLEEHRKQYHSANPTDVVKTINCPYCPKLFIKPSNRARHIANSHNMMPEFKVNCYHCQMQATDSVQLKQHFKSEHPEERISYKCPECEKLFTYLTYFKNHYKTHKQVENDKTKMNSTSEAMEVGEKYQSVDEALVEDVQIGGATAEIRDATLNVGSSAAGFRVKQEPLSDSEATISKNLPREKNSMVEEESSKHASEDQKAYAEVATAVDLPEGQKPIEKTGEADSVVNDTVEAALSIDLPEGEKFMLAEATNEPNSTAIEEQRSDIFEIIEEHDNSSAKPRFVENPVARGANVKESTANEKPSQQEANKEKKDDTAEDPPDLWNILEKKHKLAVLLEPINIDKLAELSRGRSASSSPSLERDAIKSSGGDSSSGSQPTEGGFRSKRLRLDRQIPNSDIVAGDSLIDPPNKLDLAGAEQLNLKSEPIETSRNLSDDSALNVTVASSVSATDLQQSTRGGDTTAMEPEGDLNGSDLDESEDDTFYKLDNRTYQCKLCPETMRALLEIRKHTKVQHPSQWKSFMCVHCKRRFATGPTRDRHARFHSLDHPFKCSDCDQLYCSKKNMDKHFRTYHETKSPNFSKERFHCEICQLKFVEKKYYDAHSGIYHNQLPQRLKNLSAKMQVCERCIKRFDSRIQLSKHIREAHQEDGRCKTPICQVCSKDLKTMTLLRIHILVVHMGIMPFVCQQCNAEFSSRHWLLKHMEKDHSEIALYKCSCCDESFTTEARMIEHVKASEKAHPSFNLMYRCPLCSQPVRYRKQHMRTHHDVEYDEHEHKYQVCYKCHCCSKFFQQKRNLEVHQSSLANQCDHCSMRFKTKKSLSLHLATHCDEPLQCEDCGLDFPNTVRLEEHRKRYHSANSTEVLKIINCPHCPKLFDSLSNRARHIAKSHNMTTEFKANCIHCPMQATDAMQLKQHYRSEHPKKRITYKCPDCEKCYLVLPNFKYHYKMHKQEEDDKTKMNSTSEAVEAGEKYQSVDEGLESIMKVEDVQIGGAFTEISDATLNVGSLADGLSVKQEPLSDSEATISKNLPSDKESMVEEESSEHKSSVVKVEEAISEDLSGV